MVITMWSLVQEFTVDSILHLDHKTEPIKAKLCIISLKKVCDLMVICLI